MTIFAIGSGSLVFESTMRPEILPEFCAKSGVRVTIRIRISLFMERIPLLPDKCFLLTRKINKSEFKFHIEGAIPNRLVIGGPRSAGAHPDLCGYRYDGVCYLFPVDEKPQKGGRSDASALLSLPLWLAAEAF
jgi:hypothetical protein